jgi:C-terminal processing protease CtpA/Prc
MIFVVVSQLGMVMTGALVTKVTEGGPAHNSKQIAVGDVILKVDGNFVEEDTIISVLSVNAVPGSTVQLCVAKGGANVMPLLIVLHDLVLIKAFISVLHQGPTINVDLTRMSTADFDNRKTMINLFSEIKVNVDRF